MRRYATVTAVLHNLIPHSGLGQAALVAGIVVFLVVVTLGIKRQWSESRPFSALLLSANICCAYATVALLVAVAAGLMWGPALVAVVLAGLLFAVVAAARRLIGRSSPWGSGLLLITLAAVTVPLWYLAFPHARHAVRGTGPYLPHVFYVEQSGSTFFLIVAIVHTVLALPPFVHVVTHLAGRRRRSPVPIDA